MLSERRREMVAKLQPEKITDVKEEDVMVPARDGYQIPIRVYKPETPPTSGRPLIIFYHGGGFFLGGLDIEEMNCKLFASGFGAVCVNVDYRLAPEYPFPTPINDSWDVYKWVSNILMSDDGLNSDYCIGRSKRE
jgi:acetyl esterase/lipase